jgi:phosphomannomutase
MPFPADIFRSYDIRGTDDQLSVELARAVGAATVRLTGAKRLVVGRDMRLSSPLLATGVIEGAVAAGAEVVDIGMCTTPMFNFAIFNYPEHDAGVMVTASHNPPEYNGFKMSRGDAMPISGEEMKKAIGKLEAPEPPSEDGLERKVTELDVAPAYVDRMFALANMPKLGKMKVAVDAGNGMAGTVLPDIFDRLDADLTALYFTPDGTFPNHEANPVKAENLADLVDAVKKTKAAVGVAFDGDADRVVFVDEKGNPIGGDQMLAFLASLLLKAHPGAAVVWSPNASWAVRDAIKAGGGKSVWEKVGRTNIIKRVLAEVPAIGGEVSGHYFYPEFGGMESSGYTMLLVLKAMASSGKPLSELIAPYRTYARSPEMNFTVKDKAAVLKKFEKEYGARASSIDRLDGLRFETADGWFSVRESNTEPLIRLNAEAKTPELLAAMLQDIAGTVKNA